MIDGVEVDATLDQVPLEKREVIWEGPWVSNLVMDGVDNGTGLITQRMIGITTYDIIITSGAIGTGATAPADGNTALQTPTLTGILIARQSKTSNSATIEFFIPGNSLANGTYTEFGIYCGTRLFARSIISPSYSKSTNEDSGIEYVISVTN